VVLIRVETLPRTTSGKVRRRACREAYLAGALEVVGHSPLAADGEADPAEAGPSTLDRAGLLALPAADRPAVLEAFLRERAAAALRLPSGRLPADRSWSALGIDSLAAVELRNVMEESFGIELAPTFFLEGGGVSELAGLILAGLDGTGSDRESPPAPVPRSEPLPLSPEQERLWFLEQLQPGTGAFNLPALVHLEGPLDRTALAGALRRLEERHESLRTGFGVFQGRPVQLHSPAGALHPVEVDLSALPAAVRETEAGRLHAALARLPFELARPPLLRAALLRRETEDHQLLFTVHHLVCDLWSLSLLVQETAEVYDAAVAGRPPRLAPLPLQPADVAVWQRERLQGEALEERLAYWRRRLLGAPAGLDLPLDHPRPAERRRRGGSRAFVLPAAEVEALRGVAAEEGATLFAALLAAFAALLHRWSGEEDVVVGCPVSGRLRPELERLVGFFARMCRSPASSLPPASRVARAIPSSR
jgi:acyl carrier protein